MDEIRAAGAVLWRDRHDGEIEVAVVHRPRYDDWSLPKGKLTAGETAPAGAARELLEETGYRCVLGPFLITTEYTVMTREGETAPKTVEYFAARALSGEFAPNDEVDRLKWLRVAKARKKVSYDRDREVLDAFAAHGAELRTVLLVRHARAGSKEDWAGDDDLRPLNDAGRRQVDVLREIVPLFGPDRVFAAPRVRCEQTVRPIADDIGVDVVREPLLTEETYSDDPASGIARLLALVSSDATPLIVSQGAVIPDLVSTLAHRGGVPLDDVESKKGSLWLLGFTASRNGSDPRLVSAYYLPNTE